MLRDDACQSDGTQSKSSAAESICDSELATQNHIHQSTINISSICTNAECVVQNLTLLTRGREVEEVRVQCVSAALIDQ